MNTEGPIFSSPSVTLSSSEQHEPGSSPWTATHDLSKVISVLRDEHYLSFESEEQISNDCRSTRTATCRHPAEADYVSQSDVFRDNSHTQEDIILIGSHDNCVYCVAMETGHVIWKFHSDSPVYSSPFQHSLVVNACICKDSRKAQASEEPCLHCETRSVTIDTSNQELQSTVPDSTLIKEIAVFANTKGTVFVVETDTGELLCEHQLNGEVFSSPVTVGCKVIVGCRDDFVCCFDLSALRKVSSFQT